MIDPMTRSTLGILSATEQRAALLRRCLRDAGYATRVASIPAIMRGERDVRAWLDGLDPTAILYDIRPPYDEHWYFYQWVRTLPAANKHCFLATTTDLAALEAAVGPTGACQFNGAPDGVAAFLDRVKCALAASERTVVAARAG